MTHIKMEDFMTTPEERLDAIMNKSKQMNDSQTQRKQIETELLKVRDNLKKIASDIDAKVIELVFSDIDNFLAKQGWESEISDENGKRYKQSIKNIFVQATNTASRKIGFLVSHDLYGKDNKSHRIEVSFKDPITTSGITTSTQGITIRGDMKNEDLDVWLKSLQRTEQQLNERKNSLNTDVLSYEVAVVGHSQMKKKANLLDAFLFTLENIV